MQNDPHTPGPGIFSRLPKPSHRQRRAAALGTAAAIVVVGLGAFALLPPVRAIQTAGTPTMADIAGTWDVDKVTAELTRFADACVAGALRFLLAQTGNVAENDCGLTVLAMGKYGAFELNYSSDIDLVVFYDAEKFPLAKRGDPRGAAVDIVRGLVKLLSETTSDGYVFRVDLRLRPDAGATQVAISTDAALDYYEAMSRADCDA